MSDEKTSKASVGDMQQPGCPDCAPCVTQTAAQPIPGTTLREQVREMVRGLLTREPSQDEVDTAERFVRQAGLKYRERALADAAKAPAALQDELKRERLAKEQLLKRLHLIEAGWPGSRDSIATHIAYTQLQDVMNENEKLREALRARPATSGGKND